jgi:hypothetical protein
MIKLNRILKKQAMQIPPCRSREIWQRISRPINQNYELFSDQENLSPETYARVHVNYRRAKWNINVTETFGQEF